MYDIDDGEQENFVTLALCLLIHRMSPASTIITLADW
jgi:hypothetical protein